MKRSKLWLLAGLPLAFAAACGGGDDDLGMADTTMMGDPAMTPAAAPAMTENRVQMMALNNSGVTGEATFTEEGQQTQVELMVRGAPANGTHAAHIHTGTCEAQGGVVAPLDSVAVDAGGAGSSTSTVDVALMTVMNGQHYVQAHSAAGDPVVCGNIPAHSM